MREALSSTLVLAGLVIFVMAVIAFVRLRRTGAGLLVLSSTRAAALGLAVSLGVCTAGGAVQPPQNAASTTDAPTVTSTTDVAKVLPRAKRVVTTTTAAPTTTTTVYVAPSTTAKRPAPTPVRPFVGPTTTAKAYSPPPTEPKSSGSVHPGAFCSPAGATGYSENGEPMTCASAKCDGTPYDQPRWRRANC